MSRYFYGGWAPYVPVAERRKKAARAMEKLRKKGETVSPVRIEGRRIATTFWGKAWCENLESYRDLENRLPRGRSYVRNGLVVDLQIAQRKVEALVSGSSIYKISVSIGAVPKAQWLSLCGDCAGSIDSLVELLQGRFSKGVMERFCRQNGGLFPKPSEIEFSCSCPDYASMCKHVAAVLYGVGARLDEKPELLFRLRAVDEADLVANLGKGLPLSKNAPDAGKVLETGGLSTLFGLDMAEGADPTPPVEAARKEKPAKVRQHRPAAPALKEDDLWRQVEDLIALRNGPGYDKAAALLGDLRATARKDRKMRDFGHRLAALRAQHARKGRLLDRLAAAGLGR
jgi:uncharacterized Zn finger protein